MKKSLLLNAASGLCSSCLVCFGLFGCKPEPQPRETVARATISTAPPIEAARPAKTTETEPKVALPEPAPAANVPKEIELREVFPHVRVDSRARVVEFDAAICVDAHEAESLIVFLEVLTCIPNTREHETILVTEAKPSHVHAALLLAGFKPGEPGHWEMVEKTLKAFPPIGDPLVVEIVYEQNGSEQRIKIEDWVVHPEGDATLATTAGANAGWVFAGSLMRARGGVERYEADGAGTLIGLTAFGDETIAWSAMFSPESAYQEPQWIARRGTIPARGTTVRVVLTSRRAAVGRE